MNQKFSHSGLKFFSIFFALMLPLFAQGQQKPNIILIMADDMGFSDIGCYGGEIPTPNIDKLAEKGQKFSQFYNVGRCCPTRASLLTGLQPHQAGIGHMAEDPEKPKVNDWGVHGYRGYLNRNSVTLAEVLKEAGYHTYMTGKWHIGMHGDEKRPLQRGFERYYGVLSGGASHLQPFPPRGVTTDNGPEEYSFPADYYDTDAFTDNAIKFIKDQKDDKPFFLYLAHTAPHWPLQAKKEDYEQFVGKYMHGWDEVRKDRFKKMQELGFIKKDWTIGQREMRPWNDLTPKQKEELDFRMAVYAAQVYNMDYNTGKLIDHLEKTGKLDNTLILFFSDNGASAEPYEDLGGKPIEEVNDPFKFWAVSYGQGWANASNTPFKRFKVETYEGGIATPFIAYWPAGIKAQAGKWYHTPHHIIDIMPTFVELAGTKYPNTYHNGNKIIPNEGISMVPAFKNGQGKQHEYLYWEHQNNCAIRWGKWKAVKKLNDKTWELYDMEKDRTENHNLATKHPDIVKKLDAEWYKWANSHHVLPKGKERDPYSKN